MKFPAFKAAGKIADGKCRTEIFDGDLDTEKRYHNASVSLKGLLEIDNVIYDGKQGREKVVCSADGEYKTRFEYKTDCKVKVRAY